MRTIASTIARLQAAAKASPDLLGRGWQPQPGNLLAGHCYIVCEALASLHDGLKPCVIRHGKGTHWFLRKGKRVIDPTAEQFPDAVPYEQGKGCGFLTAKPSKRAVELLRRAGFQRRQNRQRVGV
jgi:hypothetical protein